jgi:hypothetical protein
MSDTANPAKLASAAELDARLKRTDEDRWLATRYAPDGVRRLLVALYLVDLELRRTLATKEAMLGKIRIQWWRETIEQVDGKSPVRRHDLAEEVAQLIADRRDLIAPINDLIDRYDDIIDDHLRAGGHETGGEHEQLHLAAEASLTRLAGLALDATVSPSHLDALGRCGEAHLAIIADLPDYADRWIAARVAAQDLPPNLWPAILHLAADAPKGEERTPFSKRWRMFKAMLTRRLGKSVNRRPTFSE